MIATDKTKVLGILEPSVLMILIKYVEIIMSARLLYESDGKFSTHEEKCDFVRTYLFERHSHLGLCRYLLRNLTQSQINNGYIYTICKAIFEDVFRYKVYFFPLFSEHFKSFDDSLGIRAKYVLNFLEKSLSYNCLDKSIYDNIIELSEKYNRK